MHLMNRQTTIEHAQRSARAIHVPLLLAVAAILQACGGGGGTSNPGGSTQSMTYSVSLVAVELEDTSRNTAIVTQGLPIQGATITQNR